MDKVMKLKKMGSIKQFVTDEVIFNQGDTGREMYVILSGEVNVWINSVDGFPVSVAVLESGDFFGEMSVLEDLPRSATVQCLKDTTVLVIKENNFEEFITGEPPLAHKIMRGLSNRIRRLNEELKQLHKAGRAAERIPKQDEQNVPVVKFEAAPISYDETGLFPIGHKPYSKMAPIKDLSYLFDKAVRCPVCDKKINVKMIRSSKLRLKETEADFRQRFADFEPLWYGVWVCPHCYYANLYQEFQQLNNSAAQQILIQSRTIAGKAAEKYNANPASIDKVFAAYYLALYWQQKAAPDPIKSGKLWLRLSWLYQDVGDEEMYLIASDQALKYYLQAYYSDSSISYEQAQRLSLLLGELHLRQGQVKEARQFFHKAILHNHGSFEINSQAQARLIETRLNLQ